MKVREAEIEAYAASSWITDNNAMSLRTHLSPYLLDQLSFIMVKDERKLRIHPRSQRWEYSQAFEGNAETLEIIAFEFVLERKCIQPSVA